MHRKSLYPIKGNADQLRQQATGAEKVEDGNMLKRTMGNQAVTHLMRSVSTGTLTSAPSSFIQRAKLKSQEVNSMVSWAMKTSEPNQKAILLSVYKSLWQDAGKSADSFKGVEDLRAPLSHIKPTVQKLL
jgi:hypothetical protein